MSNSLEPTMKTKEEIWDAIEGFKDKLSDHHLYLMSPLMRETVMNIYETAIKILLWVLNEPINDTSTQTVKGENDE